MSIDHGKLLAIIADMANVEIEQADYGSVMMYISGWQSQLRALAQPAEAVEDREPVVWRVPTKYGVGYSFASEEVMRELCGPAEAVAVFNCPTCPVSVESRWLEPRCPECDGPTELDSAAKPISDDAKRMLALESDPTFRAQYNDAGLEPVASRQIPQNTLASKATHRCDMCGNIDVPDPVVGCRRCGWDEMVLIESAQPRDDAAQGAVAEVTLPVPAHAYITDGAVVVTGIPQHGWDEEGNSAHNCDSNGCGQAHVLYRLPFTDERDHPQAAPAQGDDTRRLDWLEGQREAYGFENEHLGNRWTIDGPFRSAREAIDAAIASAPSPEAQ